MIKKFEKEKKDKEKIAQKKLKEETKQKEKENNLLQKQILTKNKKDEKLLKKTTNLILSITNVEEENIVVNTSIKTINEGCIQIIKTGSNKGNSCGLVILNDCLCKRHYNLKNKQIV
jgi:seryl-tRNA synthetase